MPKISKASESLSKFESKYAPAGVSLPVLLATSPSRRSKVPAKPIKAGTVQENQIEAYITPIAIKNDPVKDNIKPIKEILLGVILCLIKKSTGYPMNLLEISVCRVLLSISFFSFNFFLYP